MAKLNPFWRRTAVKIGIDTYAWVEPFWGVKKEKTMEILHNSDEVFTPDIVLAETARKYIHKRMEEKAVQKRLRATGETSEIAPLNKEIAMESAKCYTLLSEKSKKENLKAPSLFDAIVLATAQIKRTNHYGRCAL